MGLILITRNPPVNPTRAAEERRVTREAQRDGPSHLADRESAPPSRGAPFPYRSAAIPEIPDTGTGADRSEVVPSPSWPYGLCPHARAVPSAIAATMW